MEKLGFPWILSSEMSVFNGLRGTLRGKIFVGPPAHERGPDGSGRVYGMRKRGSVHETNLTIILVSRKQLLALIALPVGRPFSRAAGPLRHMWTAPIGKRNFTFRSLWPAAVICPAFECGF